MTPPPLKNPWQALEPATNIEFEMGEGEEGGVGEGGEREGRFSRSSSMDSLPRDRHDILRSASVASSNYPYARSSSPKRSFLEKGLPKTAKIAFLIFNTLILLVFLGLIAADLFIIISSYQAFFHLTFKLTLIFVGLAGTLLAIIGIIGVVKEHRILLFLYFAFLLVLFLLQLGFFIYLMSGRDTLAILLEGTWDSSTDEIRNAIQSQYECCGYHDPSDHPGSTCDAAWIEGCLPVMKASLNQYLPMILGVSCSVIFVQLVCLALSSYLIFRLPTKKQLIALELEEAWRKTLGGDHEPLEVF